MKKENTKPAEKAEERTALKPKSLIIKAENLHPFENHPYTVKDDAEMNDLVESIREHGILNPLIVRPIDGKEDEYEIISGHRRLHAAEILEIKKLPCTVHYIDRDTATVMMVDSNCQRTELLPSEKAKAYKMKMDAMSRQGKRTDLTSRPDGDKSNSKRTGEMIGDVAGESERTVQRYIRLTYLIPELLQFVDEGKIKMRPAVEMSYLDEETQRDIVDCIDERQQDVFPSHAQTRLIRELAEKEEISYEKIAAIMDEPKPNQVEKVSIKRTDLTKYFPSSYTPEQIIKSILSILEVHKQREQQRKERNRDDGAR